MNYRTLNLAIVATLTLCFTFLVVILLYLSSVTDTYFIKINELKAQRKNIGYVLSGCYELEAAVRGYSVTGLDRVLDSYQTTKKNVIHRLIEYKAYRDNINEPLDQSIENLTNLRIKLLDEQLKERKNESFDYQTSFQDIIQTDVILDSLRKLIEREVEFVDKKVASKEKELTSFQNSVIMAVVILATIGCFIIMIVFFVLKRKNKENLDLNEDLMKQKMLLNKAEEITQSGSWLWNLNTNELQCTTGIYKLFKLDPQKDKVTVDLLRSFYDPEHVSEVRKTIDLAIQNRTLLELDLPIVLRNGKKRILNVQGYHFVYNDEDYYIGANWNVTKQRKQAQQLSLRNEELEDLNKELEQFAYVASHDLQEPLRKIRMFSQLLVEEQKEENLLVNKINSAAERMQQLIVDLLNFSRVSRNLGDYEKVDLNKIMDGVLDDLSLAIEEKKAIIKVQPFKREYEVVDSQMRQLFQNLISNALKFSKKDVVPQITITNTTEKIDRIEYLKITFEDNGIGFDQAYAEKIFSVFQRLHGRQEYPGTGIGLAICQKICENHDGYIEANSEEGKGAKFTIYLSDV